MIAWFGDGLWTSMFIILNILVMEVMLSLDNAAVLAIMVSKLPKEQQGKALVYGMWGAFILRGLSLAFVSLLISLWWLKIPAGLWLIYLTYSHFTEKNDSIEEPSNTKQSAIFTYFTHYLSVFWATVALVEVMDMMFSLDNIFAVTAYTHYLGLIIIGVFIGIVIMRAVAKWFTTLLAKFDFLESLAFIIICGLGVKLVFVGISHVYEPLSLLNTHIADIITSTITLAVFVLPIISSSLFNLPKKVDQ